MSKDNHTFDPSVRRNAIGAVPSLPQLDVTQLYHNDVHDAVTTNVTTLPQLFPVTRHDNQLAGETQATSLPPIQPRNFNELLAAFVAETEATPALPVAVDQHHFEEALAAFAAEMSIFQAQRGTTVEPTTRNNETERDHLPILLGKAFFGKSLPPQDHSY